MIIVDTLFQAASIDDAHFDRIMATQGEVFRRVNGRKTLRFLHGEKNYFIKIHNGVGWAEIIKNLLQLRLPILGAKNEWLAIQRLSELQVDTLSLVAYGMRGWNPARLQSFVITEELSETISLEDFCRNWRTTPPHIFLKRALIKKIALITRRLHENGVNHRDFYLCHFLLDISKPPSAENLRISLIDLHRVQLRTNPVERWIVKDLAGLFFSAMHIGLTHRDLLRFIKVYHGASLRQIFPAKHPFWHAVQSRALRLSRKPQKF